MILNEQGFWRIGISLAMGAAAAAVASVVALVVGSIKRDVPMTIPATAGFSVAIAAYLIDWYTERRTPNA